MVGRILDIVIVITGIGMAALPAGILASGFSSEISRRRERFKAAIMNWVEDASFSRNENKEFSELRAQLGITRSDAALMLWEAHAEVKRFSTAQASCPKCGYDLSKYQ